MSTLSTSLTRAGSTFWLVVTWVALDGAVSTYLLSNGVNALSSTLLMLAAVAFAAAVLSSIGPTGLAGRLECG